MQHLYFVFSMSTTALMLSLLQEHNRIFQFKMYERERGLRDKWIYGKDRQVSVSHSRLAQLRQSNTERDMRERSRRSQVWLRL